MITIRLHALHFDEPAPQWFVPQPRPASPSVLNQIAVAYPALAADAHDLFELSHIVETMWLELLPHWLAKSGRFCHGSPASIHARHLAATGVPLPLPPVVVVLHAGQRSCRVDAALYADGVRDARALDMGASNNRCVNGETYAQ